MGRVDVVLSTRLGEFTKVCVLKRMLPQLRTPEQEARFRREAAIALRLSHGAIAQTLDVVEIEGELCLLQELVHGTTLAHLAHRAEGARERLPIPLVLHVVAEIARALAYAHRFEGGGVIHRDVTPDNVMLSFSGEAKLVDFGIAKTAADQPLTEVGMVVGRPLYTAPEVLAGREADARSDVYSLGVVLWQALTGRAFPYEEGLRQPTALAPPSSMNPAVTPELDRIVAKALEPEPSARYQRAEDLRVALLALAPPGYVADIELASFVARHFNVERERRELADSIERARALTREQALRGASTTTSEAPEVGRPTRRVRQSAAAAGVALALFASFLAGTRLGPRSAAPSRVEAVHPTAALAAPAPDTRPLAAGPDLDVAPTPPPSHALTTRRPGRPEPPATTRNSVALLRDANRSFRSGDLSGALILARRAAHEGAGGEAHLIMGKILYAQNQLEAALDEFEKAKQATPGSPEAVRYVDMVRQDLGRGGR
jgi:hypothetical protein